MGYLVETSGRLLLPEPLEPQVLTVLEVELLRHEGWFREDDVQVVDSLPDLARFAAADLTRDGDWLVVSSPAGSDRTWSDQATAFYDGLARWVLQGEVQVRAENGRRWSYRYTPGGLEKQVGRPDGSPEQPEAALPTTAPPAPDVRGAASPPPGPDAWGTPPPPERDFWADDPESGVGGRTAAMAALLVVGVLLIIGVAFLAAGMVG